MDNRFAKRAHEAASSMPRPYRATVAGLVFALLTALPTAPIFAQAGDDPLPAAKPLGEPLPGPAARNFHFSADGKTVLTFSLPSLPFKDGKPSGPLKGGESEARLWDAATGKPIGPPLSFSSKDFPVGLAVHEKTVVSRRTVFDPSRKLKTEIQSWEAATGKSVWGPMSVEGSVRVVFSPDGKTIMTFGVNSSQRWDAATGKAIGEPLGLQGTTMLGFSPDGKTLVTKSRLKGEGKCQLWDVATGNPRGDPLPHEGDVKKVGFSRDGKTVLTTAMVEKEGHFRVWDAGTGKPIGEPLRLPVPVAGGEPPYRRAVPAYSPDGRTVLVATADKTAQMWDAVTGKTRGEALRHGDTVYHTAFSPDGKVLLTASGSPDKPSEVRLWDVATGTPFCRVPHKGAVTRAVFSPDGTVLLLAGEKDARLWQVPKLSR